MADRGRRRIRRVLAYAAATTVGGLVGLATLYLALGQVLATGTVQAGPWRTDPAVGSPAASPYLRAAISLAAVLALDSREVIYFFAFKDSDGRALDSACSYVVSGAMPDARWWSITAYRRDGYLPATANSRYSVDAVSIAPGAAGTFSATVVGAAERTPVGDIVFLDGGPFNLMLRLYGPAGGVPRHGLPAIERRGCG